MLRYPSDEGRSDSVAYRVTRSSLVWLLLGCVIWGVCYSAFWIHPKLSEQADAYVPIRFAYGCTSDNYFYYAKIRDVIGHEFLSSGYWEPESTRTLKITPHNLYEISFLFGSLGGQLTGSTEHAFYFNNLVWPAAICFLMALFYNFWLRNLSVAFAFSILFLVGAPELWRFPAIQFTSVPLFLLFLSYVIQQRHEDSASGTGEPSQLIARWQMVLLGTSLLVSVANFMVSWSTFGFFLLLRPRRIKAYLSLGNVVLLLACLLPGIWTLVESMKVQQTWFSFAVPPLDKYSGFKSEDFLEELNLYLFSKLKFLAILIFFRVPFTRTLLTILLGLFSGFTLTSLLHSSFLAHYFFSRGADLVIKPLPYMLLLYAGLELARGRIPLRFVGERSIRSVAKLAPVVSLAISLCAATFAGYAMYKYTRDSLAKSVPGEKHYVDGDLRQLYRFLNAPAFRAKSFGTMDPELYISLKDYTDMVPMIPVAMYTAADDALIFSRFYNLAARTGINVDELAGLLKNLEPVAQVHLVNDPNVGRLSILNMLLYYGKYSTTTLPDNEIARVSDGYRTYLEGANQDTLKEIPVHYWVSSSFEIAHVRENSQIAKDLLSAKVVFRNSNYTVYDIASGK